MCPYSAEICQVPIRTVSPFNKKNKCECDAKPKYTCETCRFWFMCINPVRNDDKKYGKCKKSAPIAITGQATMPCQNAVWPTTYYEEWCGDHEPKQ